MSVVKAKTRRKDRGRSYLLTEDQIVWSHGRHLDGASARSIARGLLERGEVIAPSEKAVLMALTTAWKRRGWEVRSRSAATAKANVERGFRPQCSHVFKAGAKQGLQCPKRAVGDGGNCWHHNPEQIAAGIARLRDGAA